MQTRIREFRKRAGLTLQELAGKIGTTPQTVQRLETANMTVSTDWLERFAQVFSVHPADLLVRDQAPDIAYLGTFDASGKEQEGCSLPDTGQLETKSLAPNPLQLEIPANKPVAIGLSQNAGPHAKGSIVIGDKLDQTAFDLAHERDCLVPLDAETILIRRAILTGEAEVTLVPYDCHDKILYAQKVEWLGPIVMTVRYFPPMTRTK